MQSRDRRRYRRATRPAFEPLETRALLSVSAYGFDAVTALPGGIGSGAGPTSLFADAGGNLFGTTISGGEFNYGTVFEIPAGTTEVRTLASFDVSTGFTPQGKIYVDGSGNVFGTTLNGGAFKRGSIWELPAGSSDIANLWSFAGGSGGAYPASGIVADASGDLWGTTLGLKSNLATVFSFDPDTGTLTTRGTFATNVHSASTLATDSSGLLAVSAGTIFGSAVNNGTHNGGFLFSLPTAAAPGTAVTQLTGGNFNTGAITGRQPLGSLLLLQDQSANPVLVGITSNGGTKGLGTIFEATVSGSTATITQLASFTDRNGAHPLGTLIATSTGPGTYTLLGVTSQGGTDHRGEIYTAALTLTSSPTDTAVITALPGSATPTVTFTKTTGSNPAGGLYRAGDGSIYLTTFSNSTFKFGSIVKLVDDPTVPADHFVFAAQPTTAIAGATLGTVTVRALTSTGVLDTAFTGNVTLSILTGPAGATLGGTVTVAAVAGVATFTDLSITQTGAYTFVAVSGPPVASAQSTKRLTITPASATQLVVTSQPTAGSLGSQRGPIVVEVQDAFGNVVTTDSSKVTLAIFAGPSLTATIAGGSLKAKRGVATFSSVRLSETGSYTLRATDGVLTLATLTPIAIGAAVDSLAISAPVSITKFQSFEVDVTVKDAATFAAGFGATVTMTVTGAPKLQNEGLTATVGADGIARFYFFTPVAVTATFKAKIGAILSDPLIVTVL